MPKKRKSENNIGHLIKAIGLTQQEFAQRLGVSASAIKKVVAGKRPISDDLRSRIYAETGLIFFSAPKEDPLEYTKENYKDYKKDITFTEKNAQVAAGLISRSVELMMIAAARPGVDKAVPVFSAITLAIENVKKEFQMEKHLDAVLQERNSTETKLYTVRELRNNNVLAEQTGYKDDPALKDDDKIPLTRTVGWLPQKDFFSIIWQHLQLYTEILKDQDGVLTEEAKARLAILAGQIQKQMNDAGYASYPTLRST
jgi:transcriptional regulator with XRE-family HTH domain